MPNPEPPARTLAESWLSANRSRFLEDGSLRGQCRRVSEALVAEVSGLTLVPGKVLLWTGDWVPHWWTVDAHGAIYDPTVEQWPAPPVCYEPWEGPLPIGKCMQCGGYVFPCAPSAMSCSKVCDDILVDELSGG